MNVGMSRSPTRDANCRSECPNVGTSKAGERRRLGSGGSGRYRDSGQREALLSPPSESCKHYSKTVPEVKCNLLAIRIGVGYLTQRGASWRRERVCGRGGIRKNCGNLWKTRQSRLSRGARGGGARPKVLCSTAQVSGSEYCGPRALSPWQA
jgi:hypothetical protein